MTTPLTTPSAAQQTAVANYFAEASTPAVIGTAEAGQHIVETTTAAGRVLEQCGRSRRLLNLALLAEGSDEFRQATTDIQQALGSVARDCEEIQRLLMQLAQHAAKIDAGNAKAEAVATSLGYTL